MDKIIEYLQAMKEDPNPFFWIDLVKDVQDDPVLENNLKKSIPPIMPQNYPAEEQALDLILRPC